MITNNEFLTLRAFQHQFTLSTAGLAIEIKRNSSYYFNNHGIIITVYPTRQNQLDNTPSKYLWFPSYEYSLEYEDGEEVTIGSDTYIVVIRNVFSAIFENISLFETSAEIERDSRTYSDLSLIQIHQLNELISSTTFTGNVTKMLELKVPLTTTPLPLPQLKAFDLEMLDTDTARISWKGTNPGDFYYYELWDSWDPVTPLLRSRINTATGQYFHTFGAITRGKYNIFTLKIFREGVTYIERQIKILMPREDFNIYSRVPNLAYTDAIYVIEEDPSGENPNIKTPVAFVWFKSGNKWYTD